MSFKDIRLDPLISRGAIGGPGFLTNIVITNSGNEFREQVWSLQRGSWDIAYAARKEAVFQPLKSFFLVVGGRANSFRFKDWLDFKVTSLQGVFTEITPTTFQFWKRYTFGSYTYDRKITKLVATPTIDTGTSGGSVASVSLTTGVVTMASGEPTAWAGEFDCHVRFDTDVMKAETIDGPPGARIVGWSSIPIIELK